MNKTRIQVSIVRIDIWIHSPIVTMLLHITKRVLYLATLLTVALVLQMQPGHALPTGPGQRTSTTEAPLPLWCSAPYSLDRETVTNRVQSDIAHIKLWTKYLLDGRGGAQTVKIPKLEGWNNCPDVVVTPGPETEMPTQLQQNISNHFWKVQHLNYMYRLLVAMVKGNTTVANRAKLDMLNMLLVSLQGQIEMYLHAEQCTNGLAQPALSYQLNTTNLFSSIGQGDCDTWSLLGRVVFHINTEAFEIEKTFPRPTIVSEVTTCSEAMSAISSLPNGMRCTNCRPQ